MLSDRNVLVDQLKHVHSDFWEDTCNDSILDIKSTKSFVKRLEPPRVIILFNLHSFDKQLSNYLVDFKGTVLNFSSQRLMESKTTNYFFGSELVFKYSIQDAISRIPEHLALTY